MSDQQIAKLQVLANLMNIETKPLKKQGRIARVYRPMHEHYIQVITVLNIQKEVNKLSLEVIRELLAMIKKNHPLFF